MRWTLRLGIGLFALVGSTARAEELKPLYTATVTADEAEVRSGAGNAPAIYPTAKLRKGDRVEILRQMEGGWLAIKPPPGSFNWVNTQFVKQVVPGRNLWVVVAPNDNGVPLLVGSTLRYDKPTVEGVRVPRGHQLYALGKQISAEDGVWLSVAPPPSDVRYIREETVARDGAQTAAATPPPAPAAPPGDFTPPAPVAQPGTPPLPGPPATPSASPPPGTPPDPVAGPATPPAMLLQQAEQAERAGNYQEAIRLYRQLGTESANTDHALSIRAYNRAQWLTEVLQGRRVLTDGNEARYSAPNRLAPSVTGPAGANAGQVNSGPGWLRRAGRCVDYSMMWILENSQGKPIIYASAPAGYSLAQYENRNVELIGTRQFRNDLHAYHMTVTQVRLLP